MGSQAKHPKKSSDASAGTTTANWQSVEDITTLAEMGDFISRLTAEMTRLDYSEKDIFGVRLGLEEAIVNAIRHGNKYDPSKKVRLAYTIDAKQIVVEVRDQGSGFDPSQVPNPLAPENIERPGGRGVFLMHTYMTWIKYNDQGNCVTLCKSRST